MAKVQGPLFSLQARGTYRDAITFQMQGERAIAGGVPVPGQPRTPLQEAHRQRFREAVVRWRGMTEAEKQPWHDNATSPGTHGWNVYLRESLAQRVEPDQHPMPTW